MSAQVHPTAVLDQPVTLGTGVQVWHFSHVSAGAWIGDHSCLGQNVYIGADVRIGARVRIQNNVSVYTGVEVADDCFLGPSCVFTNVRNPRSELRGKRPLSPTILERGVTVGANATIVCGVNLGAYAFVGAGAVVTGPVPPYALVLGNPGRLNGFCCRCGERLSGAGLGARAALARCGDCGRTYIIEGEHCAPVE